MKLRAKLLLSQIAPTEGRVFLDKAMLLFFLLSAFSNLWPRFQERRWEYLKQWHFLSADVLSFQVAVLSSLLRQGSLLLLVTLMRMYVQKEKKNKCEIENENTHTHKAQQKRERLGTDFFSFCFRKKTLFSLIVWFAWLWSKHCSSSTLSVLASLFFIPSPICPAPWVYLPRQGWGRRLPYIWQGSACLGERAIARDGGRRWRCRCTWRKTPRGDTK